MLLSLESEHLEIWKEKTEYVGVTIQYKVRYKNCKIKAGNSVVDEYGKGKTIEDACEDYIRKVQGRTLVFDAYKDTERVVKVFSCWDGTNENGISDQQFFEHFRGTFFIQT